MRKEGPARSQSEGGQSGARGSPAERSAGAGGASGRAVGCWERSRETPKGVRVEVRSEAGGAASRVWEGAGEWESARGNEWEVMG